MVICSLAWDWVWTLIILLRGVVNWWLHSSQTSSLLASKEMNFWVLLLDQVIVILLSIVNTASGFLEDKEWFKFGAVKIVNYSLFLVSFSSHFGVHKATWATRKTRKLKKTLKRKTCHDWSKTWHDLTRQNALLRHWGKRARWLKRDTIWWNPNSVSCYTR